VRDAHLPDGYPEIIRVHIGVEVVRRARIGR
jgi:hypothetical protein